MTLGGRRTSFKFLPETNFPFRQLISWPSERKTQTTPSQTTKYSSEWEEGGDNPRKKSPPPSISGQLSGAAVSPSPFTLRMLFIATAASGTLPEAASWRNKTRWCPNRGPPSGGGVKRLKNRGEIKNSKYFSPHFEQSLKISTTNRPSSLSEQLSTKSPYNKSNINFITSNTTVVRSSNDRIG